MKEALLPNVSIGQYTLMPELSTGSLIGRRVADLAPHDEYRLEAIQRGGRVWRADSDLILEDDDQITLIGPLDALPDLDQVTAILSPTNTTRRRHWRIGN